MVGAVLVAGVDVTSGNEGILVMAVGIVGAMEIIGTVVTRGIVVTVGVVPGVVEDSLGAVEGTSVGVRGSIGSDDVVGVIGVTGTISGVLTGALNGLSVGTENNGLVDTGITGATD